jgi:arabinogalactan endo-1,4-beta-galactosidase
VLGADGSAGDSGSSDASSASNPEASAPGLDAMPDARAVDAAEEDAVTPDAPSSDAMNGSESGCTTQPSSPAFMLGADISWVQQDEAQGATYVDSDGSTKEILTLLKGHGFNFIRLRTFVDPAVADGYSPTQGFCDLAHTILFAQRVKARGLGFLLDFHYSDTWADPGHQTKPLAWQGDSFADITTALHDYTKNAIQQLVDNCARPDMVQIGNEITPGMLLTPGDAMGPTSNWPQLAALLSAGIQAVHEVDPSIKIMLHLDRGGDAPGSIDWYDSAIAAGVKFDVMGESCYTQFQGTPADWLNTFTRLSSTYPTMHFAMAEYAADPSDGTELRSANDDVHDTARGIGTFIWEPTRNGGLFTANGNVYTANSQITQYDQMKSAYGL